MLYVKTDAGRNEVLHRTQALTPAHRQVLILCDGERHIEDIGDTIAADALRAALDHLLASGLLVLKDAVVKEKPVEVPLSEAERYRAVVELATSMAVDLGFTARIRAQLQIEKAQTLQDLTDV